LKSDVFLLAAVDIPSELFEMPDIMEASDNRRSKLTFAGGLNIPSVCCDMTGVARSARLELSPSLEKSLSSFFVRLGEESMDRLELLRLDRADGGINE
jgi:hypothetical protein